MLALRRLAWLLVLLTLVLVARPADAAPGFTDTCEGAMPKEQVDELLEAMRASSGACRLVRVDTQLFRTRIEWDAEGVVHEVLLAPRGCVLEPSLEGTNLAMHAPTELAGACPDAFAAMRTFVGEPREVAPLAPDQAAQWSETSEEIPAEPREVAGLLAIIALVAGAAWLVGTRRSRSPPERETDAKAWRRLALAGFGVALLARFAVEASLGNWYGAFLPVEGWGEQRFGATAALVQAGVRALLPWTVELAFGLFRVVGALAVPLTILLVRRLGGSLAAGALAGLLVALEPIPVRLSASSSEHVIAASLALAAWLSWQTTASERSWAPRVLALALAGLAVLTRADCLPQLVVLPLFTVLGQPLVEREREAWLPLRRRLGDALACLLVLAAIGAYAWLRVVVPSNHPGPAPEAIAGTADLLFVQFWVIASEPPHWLTWSGLAVAGLGCVALVALERPRLLACVGLALVAMFVPLGRNLSHDGLTGARYFVLLMPLLGLLAAATGEWVTHWLPTGKRRVLGLAGVLGFAVVELLAARSGWRHQYTFQAEYRVLAAALAERADALEGCTLWFVRPRQPTGEPDLDCCLWPASSPLQLIAPGLRFRAMPSGHEPSDADGCQLYYEGSVCALAPDLVEQSPQATSRILEQCDAMRRREGEVLVEMGVTDETLNPRFHSRPWIRLRARGL